MTEVRSHTASAFCGGSPSLRQERRLLQQALNQQGISKNALSDEKEVAS
jgi:hypothetical protein